MKWGWIDLLSSIPASNWLLLGRFAWVLRLVRVLRALRSMERLLRILLKHRIQNTLLALTTIAVLLIATCGTSSAAGGPVCAAPTSHRARTGAWSSLWMRRKTTA
jgi:hypothetical protein